jgi:hypothetical protein
LLLPSIQNNKAPKASFFTVKGRPWCNKSHSAYEPRGCLLIVSFFLNGFSWTYLH